jgi:hypothetical protein
MANPTTHRDLNRISRGDHGTRRVGIRNLGTIGGMDGKNNAGVQGQPCEERKRAVESECSTLLNY